MFTMRKSANSAVIYHLEVFILIGLLRRYDVIALSNQLPCEFRDSVNITDGTLLQQSQNIIYDGVEFTPADYAQIHYDVIRGVERVSTQPYLRGCLCNRRPCIRVCCPFASVVGNRNVSKTCASYEKVHRSDHEIIHPNDTKQSVILGAHFSFINNDYPCAKMYVGDTDFQITHVSMRTEAPKIWPVTSVRIGAIVIVIVLNASICRKAIFCTKTAHWSIISTASELLSIHKQMTLIGICSFATSQRPKTFGIQFYRFACWFPYFSSLPHCLCMHSFRNCAIWTANA